MLIIVLAKKKWNKDKQHGGNADAEQAVERWTAYYLCPVILRQKYRNFIFLDKKYRILTFLDKKEFERRTAYHLCPSSNIQ